MESVISQEKRRLRTELRAVLTALDPQQKRAGDRAMIGHLLALPQLVAAQTVLLYWGMGALEVDTLPLADALVAQGKRVCMPRTLPGHGMQARTYRPGDPYDITSFGVKEPTQQAPLMPKGEIQFALVPGLAFDRRGRRLGFGGGYYDRWLAEFQGDTAALCRKGALRDAIPVEYHDCRVQVVICEDGPIPATD